MTPRNSIDMQLAAVQHVRPPSPSPASNPRQIIASLLSALPQTHPSNNPLRDLSSAGAAARNIFLTLYALFEKELLPALDLLDRSLITRLKPADNTSPSLFLVRSAQQSNSARHSSYEHVNYYEVRLDAWSCSCPAFTFAAFPASAAPLEGGDRADPDDGLGTCFFGGLTRGTGIVVCKHLLSCVLVQECQMFAHFVEQKEVSLEEIAGWAAGWGD